jgi:hypothetical protein
LNIINIFIFHINIVLILYSILINFNTLSTTNVTVMNWVCLSCLTFFKLNWVLTWIFIFLSNWLRSFKFIYIHIPMGCVSLCKVILFFCCRLEFFVHTIVWLILLSIFKIRNWYFYLWSFWALFFYWQISCIKNLRSLFFPERLILKWVMYIKWQITTWIHW